MDKMLEAMDKKHVTAFILLDLSKAFDSINHTILLHNLKCVGASPLAIQWFHHESYLSGRPQYVRIGSTVSSTSALTHGVPQGSILSTFLFGIYVDDLPAVTVSSDLDSYDDDSKLHLAMAKLGNDLYKTAKWCLEHQLLINPDKTKFHLEDTISMLQNLPTQINLNFLRKTLKPTANDGIEKFHETQTEKDALKSFKSTSVDKKESTRKLDEAILNEIEDEAKIMEDIFQADEEDESINKILVKIDNVFKTIEARIRNVSSPGGLGTIMSMA
ncbi:Hypothetical predicted protein [Paramuricea clavata]|uniref:Uncharacterized protein n=1 Tax=Paramuricea clavata TaxID=317549 RepID=A0A7D9HSI3_PARCT|nr:Hypothetical predicted protein [Paramuricea clavata]